MGAISDVLLALPEVSVYATKFTMEIVKNELKEAGIEHARLKEIRPHSKIDFANDLVVLFLMQYVMFFIRRMAQSFIQEISFSIRR